jgi:hypothetical protein
MVRDKGVFVPVKFAPGEDGTALLEKSTDTFTIALAPLMLVFTKREV